MLIVSTPQLDGRPIRHHLGLVHGGTILGANLFRDLLASGTAGNLEPAMPWPLPPPPLPPEQPPD